MKIALVTPAWPGTHTPNGIATAVRHLATGLAEIGHSPIIIALKEDGPAPDDTPVIAVSQAKWTLRDKVQAKLGVPDMGQKLLARQIAQAAAIAQDQHGAEIVIIEETQGWAGALCDQLSIPVVVTLHGPWLIHKAIQPSDGPAADQRREDREALALQRCAGITAPSRNVLETMQKALTLPPTPQEVIANPIELPSQTRTPDAKIPDSILFVGRFDRHKGGDVVIEAFAKLAAQNPRATLSFAGPDRGVRQADGSTLLLKQALAGLAPDIAGRITYLGPQSGDKVAKLRTTHAITLIASRYENLNYTLLEAMASGAAMVSTNQGGPGEVLRHEETALLVEPEDADAMAQALGRLLDQPDFAEKLGQAARKQVEADFLPQPVARQLDAFIQRIISSET